MVTINDCSINGHYYKVEIDECVTDVKVYDDNPDTHLAMINKLRDIGATFYVKCQRCDHRIIIYDKTYQQRKDGTYKL